VVDYQKSLEIGPQKYEYYLNLSIAYYYLGQLNKSCEAFKKGEKLGGNFKCLPKKMRKEIKLCE